jgi:outer membrane biosynthesis protein TonB
MKGRWLILSVLWLAGCGSHETPGDRAAVPGAMPVAGEPSPIPVEVLGDTGEMAHLDVKLPPPQARVWMARVEPARGEPPRAPLPDAAVDTSLPEALAAPELHVDPSLRPPILRTSAPLRIPGRARGRNVSVELEVRVDPDGYVSNVRWAGGDRDTALVAAAIECARAMTFYPALLGADPVGVWCRQRFDFGGQ